MHPSNAPPPKLPIFPSIEITDFGTATDFNRLRPSKQAKPISTTGTPSIEAGMVILFFELGNSALFIVNPIGASNAPLESSNNPLPRSVVLKIL